jgi:hypothetical protein
MLMARQISTKKTLEPTTPLHLTRKEVELLAKLMQREINDSLREADLTSEEVSWMNELLAKLRWDLKR